MRNIWRPALRAAGMDPVGVHILRHTCASLLIAQGAPVKAIQAQLGHSSAEPTPGRYGHLYPDDLDALSARLDIAHASAKRTRGQGSRRPRNTVRRRGEPPAGAKGSLVVITRRLRSAWNQ